MSFFLTFTLLYFVRLGTYRLTKINFNEPVEKFIKEYVPEKAKKETALYRQGANFLSQFMFYIDYIAKFSIAYYFFNKIYTHSGIEKTLMIILIAMYVKDNKIQILKKKETKKE